MSLARIKDLPVSWRKSELRQVLLKCGESSNCDVTRVYALGMQIFPIAHSIVMHLIPFAYSQNDLNAVAADVISPVNSGLLPGFTVYLMVAEKLLLFPLLNQMIPN